MVTKEKFTFDGVEYRIILVDDYSDLEGNPLYESNSFVFKIKDSNGKVKSVAKLTREVIDSIFNAILFNWASENDIDSDCLNNWLPKAITSAGKFIAFSISMLKYYYRKVQLLFC